MFTSQKTFGVNPYFSAPSGAPEKAPETPISPQERLKVLQSERAQFKADINNAADPKARAIAEAAVRDLTNKINELQAQMAEQAEQSSQNFHDQVVNTPDSTPEAQTAAI